MPDWITAISTLFAAAAAFGSWRSAIASARQSERLAHEAAIAAALRAAREVLEHSIAVERLVQRLKPMVQAVASLSGAFEGSAMKELVSAIESNAASIVEGKQRAERLLADQGRMYSASIGDLISATERSERDAIVVRTARGELSSMWDQSVVDHQRILMKRAIQEAADAVARAAPAIRSA